MIRNLRGLEMELTEREQVAAATDGTFSKKNRIPDPPLQIEPHNNAGFDLGGQPIITLSWRRPRANSSVHLQVSRSHRFISEEVDVDAPALAKDGARLEAISTGTYFWRVATVGSEDLRSEWSTVRRFRIFSSDQQSLLQDDTPPPLEVNPPHQLGNLFIIQIGEASETVTSF